MTRFLTKFYMNKTQRQLIRFFHQYHLDENDVNEDKEKDCFDEEVDMFMDEGFNPDEIKIDRLIYESIFPDYNFQVEEEPDD